MVGRTSIAGLKNADEGSQNQEMSVLALLDEVRPSLLDIGLRKMAAAEIPLVGALLIYTLYNEVQPAARGSPSIFA